MDGWSGFNILKMEDSPLVLISTGFAGFHFRLIIKNKLSAHETNMLLYNTQEHNNFQQHGVSFADFAGSIPYFD
jgi:hypothetical protein